MEVIINEAEQFGKAQGKVTFVVRLSGNGWVTRKVVIVEDQQACPEDVIRAIANSIGSGSPTGITDPSTERGILQIGDQVAASWHPLTDKALKGFLDGREWALTQATRIELNRLRTSAASGETFEDLGESLSAYSADERFIFTIQPESDGDRAAAQERWLVMVGEPDDEYQVYVSSFARGALDAAVPSLHKRPEKRVVNASILQEWRV